MVFIPRRPENSLARCYPSHNNTFVPSVALSSTQSPFKSFNKFYKSQADFPSPPFYSTKSARWSRSDLPQDLTDHAPQYTTERKPDNATQRDAARSSDARPYTRPLSRACTFRHQRQRDLHPQPRQPSGPPISRQQYPAAWKLRTSTTWHDNPRRYLHGLLRRNL